MKEVLTVETKTDSLRSEIVGWTHENPEYYVPNKPIGYTYSPSPPYTPDTILEALANGWELLGPPQSFEYKVDGENKIGFTWWLTKETR